MLTPVAGSLVIALQSFFLRTFEYRDVEVFRIQFQHLHQIFPCHVDGTFLEIVAERPVAEHFEHRVVIGVITHLLQVVVLAAHAQTLLRVGTAARLRRARSEDDVFPLVHTCVGEHQCGVVFDYHRRRRLNGVLFRLEKLFERVAYFVCCHHDM